jgi:rRNA pseudouridine-1189 N-methylase Emg1 (Nep1/Mra1 family)
LQKDTQNKRKKLKLFDWRKKNKGKIKRYILLKCKTIKTLLFEQDETNRRGRAKPLHASLKNSLLFLSNLPSTSFWSHHHTPAKKKP